MTSCTCARVRVDDEQIGLAVDDDVSIEWGVDEYIPIVTVVARDYERLDNLPKIDGVTLIGDKTAEEIGIRSIGNSAILDLFR